jgi:circadian clock protein KaiC
MMRATSDPPLDRLGTGVPGLDVVLQGGLFQQSVYSVEGPPGAGKTILANQMCHHHASLGEQVVYVTLMTESHARMIAHLRRLSFFRPELVAKQVHYVSAFGSFEAEGHAGLLRVIRDMVTSKKPVLLVVDGFSRIFEGSASASESNKLVYELQALAGLTGCTMVLLLTCQPGDGPSKAEAVVDGVLELTDEVYLLRPLRHLQVRKFRGAGPVRGMHTLEIGPDGVSLLPRVEAQLLRQPAHMRLGPGPTRVDFGIHELDEMLHGGLPSCSTTMLYGQTGAGKTLLAMHFLAAGARRGERGLFFGFYERPDALLKKSARTGLGLESDAMAALVRFAWEPFGEACIDVVAEHLLSLIREHEPRRLCIDGLQGFLQVVDHPDRPRAVMSALIDEIEAAGVTTLYTAESKEFFGPLKAAPTSGISAVTHNIIVMRHAKADHRLCKELCILKLRDSDFDARLQEFYITERGIVMGLGARAATRAVESGRPGLGEEPRRPREHAGAAPQPHILIVDDEFGLAELVAEVLAAQGYRTSIAINGALGLELLRERRPDLVLVDLMMPVLSGVEMLGQIRADPAIAETPVVLMTAVPEAVPDPPAGYAAVLQKPFTPEQLFDVVAASVGGASR